MNETERERIEERLHEERQRALQRLRQAEQEESESQGEAAGDLSRYPTHLADEGSDTQEEERDFIVASQASETLTRIDEALERLYSEPESFDRCERCGGRIEVERLELIPWTRLCADCAREADG